MLTSDFDSIIDSVVPVFDDVVAKKVIAFLQHNEDELVLFVLKDSLELLDHGRCWLKGQSKALIGSDMKFCSIGAISTCCDKAFTKNATRYLYIKVLKVFVKANDIPYDSLVGSGVVWFNDNRQRVWEDIELAFKKAIAYQEEVVYGNGD